MNTSLEQKRRLIEDLELIEYAITKRIKINPDIYKPENTQLNHNILKCNKFMKNSITELQRHEISQLIEKYETSRRNLVGLLIDEDTKLSDINVFKDAEFEKGTFTSFLNLCNDVIEQGDEKDEDDIGLKDHEVYDMFSASKNYDELKHKINEYENPYNTIKSKPLTRKKVLKKLENSEKFNYLSDFTSNLKSSLIFTPLEEFGTQFDLKLLFTDWLSLPRFKSISNDKIPKYKNFIKFLNYRDSNIKVEDTRYLEYLERLVSYLKGFKIRSNPLDMKKHENDSKLTFKHADYFCLVCNKQFTKETSYNIHLNGKKHKSSMKRVSKILEKECEIANILQFELKKEWENTIDELERIDLLTVRERELELHDRKPEIGSELAPISLFFDRSLRRGREAEERKNMDGGDNDDDDDDDDEEEEEEDEFDEKLYNPLNLPIGLDGRPMPFWLYKIKGLTHEFKCEICDNEVFRGRTNYNKHFKNSKHTEGLKKLGVMSDFTNFKFINTKKEVLKLLETIQLKKRQEAQFADDVQQVEDDEGNAMSKKVYDQLKKQGLL